MTDRPALPPLFNAVAVDAETAPFAKAIALAKEQIEAGTVVWSGRSDRYRSALVLAPERSLEESLPVVLVALLGMGDALGALIPPVVAVTFGWPDRIEINGGMAGKVRLAVAETPNPTAIPDWLVVGFDLAHDGGWVQKDEQAQHQTTLLEEGCQIDHVDLLEALSRHLLAWINRWQSDGIQPVLQAWMSRSPEIGKPIDVEIAGRTRKGVFKGLSDQGGLELVDQGRQQIIPLNEALLTTAVSS